jgi:cell division protein FtsI/penicillin-binding protein 2
MSQQRTWRYLTAVILLALACLAIIVQIVRLQTDPEVQNLTNRGEYTYQYYYPARGEIYDRNGNLLAGNTTVYEVGVTLATINGPKAASEIAQAAQAYLGKDYDQTFSLLNNPPQGSSYLVLADFITPDMVAKLQEFIAQLDKTGDTSLDGLGFRAHLARNYPNGDLASNLLGFVNQEQRGYFGVEEKYDNLLAGVPIALRVSLDPLRADELPEVQPGVSLILTIDEQLQAYVEDTLDQAVSDSGSDSGTVVVINPRTGEILALASTPRMNLNDYSTISQVYPGDTPFDRANGQAFEPGSVFKILTMAGALDSGTVTPSSTVYDDGTLVVDGAAIHDWNGGAWGTQDMTGCLANSLNVCLGTIALKMGPDIFYNYMQRFGIGRLTGVDLAGEVTGYLRLPSDPDWTDLTLANNAFGQGVSVTPLQMVMAATAIANDGKMVEPHILYATVVDGVQHDMPTQVVATPISAATAHTLNDMLEVSLETEGSKGLVPGYRISGKTGTAEIPTPDGYDSQYTNASFIGWGPTDNPQFMVYVWLSEPKTSQWGSIVAAPVFKQIVEKLVLLEDIPPDSVRQQMSGN